MMKQWRNYNAIVSDESGSEVDHHDCHFIKSTESKNLYTYVTGFNLTTLLLVVVWEMDDII